MKIYLLGILICININLFAHDPLVHQHITREAFKLFKKNHPKINYHLLEITNDGMIYVRNFDASGALSNRSKIIPTLGK